MYKFQPILKTLVWGTESWVLSGWPGDESVVAEGPDAGKKITDIYEGQFPLLIKFIDSHRDLSIQVHPDDEMARRLHGCKGKNEMWYVIGAKPGAHLMSGLSRQITPDEYEELVKHDQIVSALASYEVKPGDVFFLPAGRVHTLGGGCYVAEIQETSDITYRIYDYGRVGLDGKPRKLHIQEAKEAIDYRVLPDYRTHYEPRENEPVKLIHCKHFSTDLLDLSQPLERALDDCGEFLIVICMEGSVKLATPGDSCSLVPGECALVPSNEKSLKISPSGKAKLLTTFVPR
ncbi:MAG: class I mannose-6-phosphate isomerase [Bacteroidales bacterium]|nr:class I mannose-6-phosphate isomerase [Bacteroidales bacterium]